MKNEQQNKRSPGCLLLVTSCVIITGVIICRLGEWGVQQFRTPYPDPPPTRVPFTPTPFPYEGGEITEARKQFGEGKIAFNPPKEMIVGKTETLEARITHQDHAAFIEGLKGANKIIIEKLKVSCKMRVTLKSEKDVFNITPIISSETRVLDPHEPFSPWIWSVTPQKSGTHNLYLVAEAIADVPKLGEKPLYVKTFDYTITVRVTTDSVRGWIAKHWQYFLSSIAIPIVIWLWSLYNTRKEKKEKEVSEKKPPEPPKIIIP